MPRSHVDVCILLYEPYNLIAVDVGIRTILCRSVSHENAIYRMVKLKQSHLVERTDMSLHVRLHTADESFTCPYEDPICD